MALCQPTRLLTPKAGNRPDEYEDAFSIAHSVRTLQTRIAITDGASESAFAKSWAQILANAFVEGSLDLSNPSDQDLADWLRPCQKRWDQNVPWERIPWHGEAKARSGALATMLALTVALIPNSRERIVLARPGHRGLLPVHNSAQRALSIFSAAQFGSVEQHTSPGLQQLFQQPGVVGQCRPTARRVVPRRRGHTQHRRSGRLDT